MGTKYHTKTEYMWVKYVPLFGDRMLSGIKFSSTKRKLSRFLLVLVPILIALEHLPCPAYGDSLLRSGETLTEFRAQLLRDGWKPIETYKKNHDGTLEHSWADAADIFGAGYLEVESCSGTGLNYCFFDYKKNNKCLRITTQGEFIPKLGAQPRLISWREKTCVPEIISLSFVPCVYRKPHPEGIRA